VVVAAAECDIVCEKRRHSILKRKPSASAKHRHSLGGSFGILTEAVYNA